MLKVLIADDEPKIRRGLKNSIDWSELDIEIAGEAEDGEVALAMAKSIQPDILLVDICMPFIDGLELVDKIKEILPDSLVIVITGHDEFTYAQQAIKLQVFDYLLKPVVKEYLYSVIKKAKEELLEKRSKAKYINWASQQLKRNLPFLRERFFSEWLNGNFDDAEIKEQFEFLGIDINPDASIFIVKALERYNTNECSKEWDRQLLLFAIQNIIEELLEKRGPVVAFRDNKNYIAAITCVNTSTECNDLCGIISSTIEKYLNQPTYVAYAKIDNGLTGIPHTYRRIVSEITSEENWSPIVTLSKKYIDDNYYKEDLCLQEVANELKISSAYLSRLLRQELGASFIDYLTQHRIKKAIQLMNDPFIKIYEVAEKVGYSSQHYFSTAFKKVIGISPAEYRKGGMN